MILVTGGAGYIGSHTCKLLDQTGRESIVFDNLVYGHRELAKWSDLIVGNLSDKETLNAIFREHSIEAVIHFASYAYVGESMTEPSKYYNNNVVCALNLLEAMRANHCNIIVFSSTCATYGIPQTNPITEDMPQNPINPYGRTKLMIEQILGDYASAYSIKYVILRYFNACGADPDCEIGEWHEPETHLIPLILDAASGARDSIRVFGNNYQTPDGTCIRDYVHVNDLAEAHIQALDYLNNGGKNDCFNLGTRSGNSVLEVINAVKRVTGRDFQTIVDARRPGDPAVLVGDNQRAMNTLGWKPQYTNLDTIIKHAWAWHCKQRNTQNHV